MKYTYQPNIGTAIWGLSDGNLIIKDSDSAHAQQLYYSFINGLTDAENGKVGQAQDFLSARGYWLEDGSRVPTYFVPKTEAIAVNEQFPATPNSSQPKAEPEMPGESSPLPEGGTTEFNRKEEAPDPNG